MSQRHNTRRLWYLPAFLLPAVLLTIAYALEGFAPFGDRSILTSDMASQYVEFFCGLKSGDVFFSWSKALGTSYIGVFSYYLSSPLSLLTLLVPNECMPVGLLWLTVLKFGLAGLTAFLFFSRRFPGRGAAALLCSACYAMCAYSVAYSTCIMWLDGVIWLPVILLGLDQLLDGTRRWPFACALAVCFLSTWYISYMIGGFCLLWFLVQGVVRRLSLLADAALFEERFQAAAHRFLFHPAALAEQHGRVLLRPQIQVREKFALADRQRRFAHRQQRAHDLPHLLLTVHHIRPLHAVPSFI